MAPVATTERIPCSKLWAQQVEMLQEANSGVFTKGSIVPTLQARVTQSSGCSVISWRPAGLLPLCVTEGSINSRRHRPCYF